MSPVHASPSWSCRPPWPRTLSSLHHLLVFLRPHGPVLLWWLFPQTQTRGWAQEPLQEPILHFPSPRVSPGVLVALNATWPVRSPTLECSFTSFLDPRLIDPAASSHGCLSLGGHGDQDRMGLTRNSSPCTPSPPQWKLASRLQKQELHRHSCPGRSLRVVLDRTLLSLTPLAHPSANSGNSTFKTQPELDRLPPPSPPPPWPKLPRASPP